ncbi:hypothetical protein [Umezawaea beigongshangensis]|uniref:hypothetical protein n=1 Tax=Umezawaea beigongshangensis TaxID=2780383 RepID=UPI0018F1714F|nr:hypothetical protein [Umezawaea beigongshangensis]
MTSGASSTLERELVAEIRDVLLAVARVVDARLPGAARPPEREVVRLLTVLAGEVRPLSRRMALACERFEELVVESDRWLWAHDDDAGHRVDVAAELGVLHADAVHLVEALGLALRAGPALVAAVRPFRIGVAALGRCLTIAGGWPR